MALFVVYCKDKPGALETRVATRPTHLDYLNGSTAVKAAGPLLDDAGSPIGSLLIIEADDKAAVQTLVDNDPYTAAGLFESVAIDGWRVGVGSING
ncbi:YciI family protein [Caulobacter sp. RHG1]|uniref:YciI family protein n=1 Tax=Caulobacter sp. (strain RHG1) TaxID=2545762 RepID=UPI0015583344|nr:YciI family protein [Caulobacter sp. RHG1]NQE62149.1 YciL protein [Caulobacter sp. RHG1]